MNKFKLYHLFTFIILALMLVFSIINPEFLQQVIIIPIAVILGFGLFLLFFS